MNSSLPVFSLAEMEKYFAKYSIHRELMRVLPHLQGRLLDVGCGEMPYRATIIAQSDVQEYLGLDLPAGKYFDRAPPDLTWDGKTIPSPDGWFDCAICLEVLEHTHNPRIVLEEIYRVLKPGGVAVWSVPFLWPLHDVPHDHYRFTPFFFEEALSTVGYEHVSIRSLGGWDASLAQMFALWIDRRPLSEAKKRLLRLLFGPALRKLFLRDSGNAEWRSDEMFTGLFVRAEKSGPNRLMCTP